MIVTYWSGEVSVKHVSFADSHKIVPAFLSPPIDQLGALGQEFLLSLSWSRVTFSLHVRSSSHDR